MTDQTPAPSGGTATADEVMGLVDRLIALQAKDNELLVNDRFEAAMFDRNAVPRGQARAALESAVRAMEERLNAALAVVAAAREAHTAALRTKITWNSRSVRMLGQALVDYDGALARTGDDEGSR